MQRLYRSSLLAFLLVIAVCENVHAQPINQNLWGTNGQVKALAKDGNTLYAGGTFTRVAPNVAYGASVNTSTAQPDADLPRTNGQVYCVTSDGTGGWYVG